MDTTQRLEADWWEKRAVSVRNLPPKTAICRHALEGARLNLPRLESSSTAKGPPKSLI